MKIEIKKFKINVANLMIESCEDPMIFASEPILEWKNTEQGKWVMENALDIPEFHIKIDENFMNYMVSITAELSENDYSFWLLKWK